MFQLGVTCTWKFLALNKGLKTIRIYNLALFFTGERSQWNKILVLPCRSCSWCFHVHDWNCWCKGTYFHLVVKMSVTNNNNSPSGVHIYWPGKYTYLHCFLVGQILYTGDFSRQEDRHLMAAEIPSISPDVLIIVSTKKTIIIIY